MKGVPEHTKIRQYPSGLEMRAIRSVVKMIILAKLHQHQPL